MNLGLFSISYAGLWGQDSVGLEAFVRRAGELGYGAVMIAGKRPHLAPIDASDARIESLQRSLSDAAVTCSVVAAYNDFGASSGAEVPLGEMQIQYVESLCRVASRMGARIVRVFTAYLGPGADQPSVWKRTTVALREIADRAAAYGVTIAIQNHHDLAVDTASLLELLSDIDRSNCKLAYDAWSPALRGEDLYEAAKRAAPQVAITTNADYVRVPRFRYRPELINYEQVTPDLVRAVPFGSGFIDYGRFFQGLEDGGFDGVASYEMCSPIQGGGSIKNLDEFARLYVDWMKGRGFAA